VEPGAGTVHLRLKVVPGASRDEVVGLHGDRIRVKVTAPPEGGKANRAVVALLAERLGVARRDVEILQGESSPLKTAAVRGLTADDVLARLA
jgi:uncharacterized protein (TIGR00251 family)